MRRGHGAGIECGGRHLKVDAEQALRDANRKFERRFRFVEGCLAARGAEPGPDVRDEMETYWEAAKTAGLADTADARDH
jgi:ATP diphosphatase